MLSPDAMLARLDRAAGTSPFDLLAGGARDLPPRQRTQRRTIAWSHELLDEPERQLFARLSVFVGGFTLGHGAWVMGHGSWRRGRIDLYHPPAPRRKYRLRRHPSTQNPRSGGVASGAQPP